jgi:uncharacterized protein (DUF2141 family)
MNRSPLFIALAAVACAVFTTHASAQAGCAAVEVHNVRPQQGFLMVAAYADADSFNKKPMLSMRVPAGEAITKLQLCGLAGSQVAVTMFQDLDSDGQRGKSLLGIPTEPWGSSGTPGAFGPAWETAKTALDGSTIVVRLSQ